MSKFSVFLFDPDNRIVCHCPDVLALSPEEAGERALSRWPVIGSEKIPVGMLYAFATKSKSRVEREYVARLKKQTGCQKPRVQPLSLPLDIKPVAPTFLVFWLERYGEKTKVHGHIEVSCSDTRAAVKQARDSGCGLTQSGKKLVFEALLKDSKKAKRYLNLASSSSFFCPPSSPKTKKAGSQKSGKDFPKQETLF